MIVKRNVCSLVSVFTFNFHLCCFFSFTTLIGHAWRLDALLSNLNLSEDEWSREETAVRTLNIVCHCFSDMSLKTIRIYARISSRTFRPSMLILWEKHLNVFEVGFLCRSLLSSNCPDWVYFLSTFVGWKVL